MPVASLRKKHWTTVGFMSTNLKNWKFEPNCHRRRTSHCHAKNNRVEAEKVKRGSPWRKSPCGPWRNWAGFTNLCGADKTLLLLHIQLQNHKSLVGTRWQWRAPLVTNQRMQHSNPASNHQAPFFWHNVGWSAWRSGCQKLGGVAKFAVPMLRRVPLSHKNSVSLCQNKVFGKPSLCMHPPRYLKYPQSFPT